MPEADRADNAVVEPSVETRVGALEGAALDWAVAFAMCLEANNGRVIQARDLADRALRNGPAFSTDSSFLGRLIAREGMTVGPWTTSPFAAHLGPAEAVSSANPRIVGPTPLVAALRCYVVSKVGDTVWVPAGLVPPGDGFGPAADAPHSRGKQGPDFDVPSELLPELIAAPELPPRRPRG